MGIVYHDDFWADSQRDRVEELSISGIASRDYTALLAGQGLHFRRGHLPVRKGFEAGKGGVNFLEVLVEVRPQEIVLRYPLMKLIVCCVCCHLASLLSHVRRGILRYRGTRGRNRGMLWDE